jgi:protein O-mannosyl-transferase
VLVAVASITACTALATLAKANGILLPVFVLALEYTALPAPTHGQRIHARMRTLICWTTTVTLLVALVLLGVAKMLHGVDHRPWTEGQRLLTEPRILWTYLYDLWIPRAYSAGLFNDAYPVSRSILQPWTTLPALAGIVLLIVTAIRGRRTYPLFAAAVLFYFGGHLIESTTVPLELYFEHRNYLPAMLLFLPAAAWLAGFKLHPGIASNKSLTFISRGPWRVALTLATLAALAGMTYANARIWGDTALQGRIWARLNPGSPRAQVTAATDELQQGDATSAINRLAPMLAAHPREVQLSFNVLSARCKVGGVTAADLDAASYSLRQSMDPGALIVGWYERITPVVAAGGCPGLTLTDLIRLARDGESNPLYPAGRRQDLAHAEGVVQMASHQPEAALASFNRALDYTPRLETALAQAAFLGASGYPALGLAHLTHYDALPRAAEDHGLSAGMPAIHAWVLEKQQYWEHERTVLQHTLTQAENESR